MGTYVPAVLRHLVSERAAGRCEYCRYTEEVAFFAFEIEHIISEKHGGPTTAENLALACPCCNRAKGTDLGSLDPKTGQLTPFFNPRTQLWHEHFSLDTQGYILPRTAEGRVTVRILQFNDPDRVQERRHLIATGHYPYP